jgi:hypothetical protein
MATAFRKGDTVKVHAVIPQGPVLAFRMDDDGNVWYLISWVDVAGNPQQRWFIEGELVAAT